jgi:multisubunit Na+/H+ antiporter MnhG subunit
MGFFKDIFNNFLALIFAILGIIAFIFAIASFFITALVSTVSPWLWFIIFIIAGLLCFAIARAFGKRG